MTANSPTTRASKASSKHLLSTCFLLLALGAVDTLPHNAPAQSRNRYRKPRTVTPPPSAPPVTPPGTGGGTSNPPSAPPQSGSFQLDGLTSPATVSDSIFVLARGVASSSSVTYLIDGATVSQTTTAPYWLGSVVAGKPSGFNVSGLSAGSHTLSATAKLPDGTSKTSGSISLNVVPSINGQFSNQLTAYPNQFPTQQLDLPSVVGRTTTSGAAVTNEETKVRTSIAAMYRNWGADVSFDSGNDQSALLAAWVPTNAAAPTANRNTAPVSMWFSPDSPFYHAIPSQWPRVELPQGYFQTVQFNTAYRGDGIGFGEIFVKTSDPQLPVVSQWYDVAATRVTFPFHMPLDWTNRLPTQPAGDSHLIFIDPTGNTFFSTYKTHRDSSTGGPVALYASKPSTIAGLGTKGGSIAAAFAELPAMIQPGEAIDPNREIGHAIGGPVSRTWAARVFPASAWDAGILTSTNGCTNKGLTNTGLVPYGGIIQLDPALDLKTLNLTLPARRVLRAMQVYGYYVMDFGCTDFDIYTAIDESELEPFGGPWGNAKGIGVQNELQNVLRSNRLYVVAPLTKKQ
jgi:hypothetical protein